MIVVFVDHDRGVIAPGALEAISAVQPIAADLGTEVDAITIGTGADGLAGELAGYGVSTVHQAHHDMLDDYGPEAWGEVVAQATDALDPAMLVATGTERGNEVLAQAAARRDLPMVANCLDITPGSPNTVRRVRWGGSLIEESSVDTPMLVATIAQHAFDPTSAVSPGSATPSPFTPDLDPMLGRSLVKGRVEREAGITLSTAAVVVGGGRGVGSPEGFAPLERLAELLGGAVGCSRAVTNNGWRNHADQVGQTGTRIAPDVYFACGISGAIQHWVGAMASKTIVAINIDPEANMVSRADYAVIADLHEVVPAISAEIEKRRHSG
jgi:electron transfer flavoprotein alpha subunit